MTITTCIPLYATRVDQPNVVHDTPSSKIGLYRVVSLLGRMDAAYCSHVRSHQQGGLAENAAADQLAALWMKHPQMTDLHPTKLDPTIPFKQSIIQSLHISCGAAWRFFDESSLPLDTMPLLPSSRQCENCGCPSHHTSQCFMIRKHPSMSSYTREKPIRRAAFCESFLHPEDIDWDAAPAVMDDHTFVQFLGTMFSLATRSETILQAYKGLILLCEHYYFSPLRSKLLKKKIQVRPDSDGPCLDNEKLHESEELAKKLHMFAKIAHVRKWGRAMSYVHKTERINPLDPRVINEWNAIHPPSPTEADELYLEYNHSHFEVFQIDRHTLSKKIDSWDITKSSGLNGFPPAFLIHFNNLTAKLETDDNVNTYFTSLVLFIKNLASGKAFELREVALNYKGALLNKLPAHVGFKVRNLGMSDVFHRLAAYSVLLRSIGPATEVHPVEAAITNSMVDERVGSVEAT
jgi:hypothetical protein